MKTKSELIKAIAKEFHGLSDDEKENFPSRIALFDSAPRIVDIPSIIKDQQMRSIRRYFREAVFERLEGWWNETIINLLAGKRTEAIYGYEVSDKLSAIATAGQAQAPADLQLELRSGAGSNRFQIGEDIRLDVLFSSTSRGRYLEPCALFFTSHFGYSLSCPPG